MLIEIDGSEGEGGGQILRSALALSILGAREVWLNMHGQKRKAELAAVTTVTAPIRTEIDAGKTGAGG